MIRPKVLLMHHLGCIRPWLQACIPYFSNANQPAFSIGTRGWLLLPSNFDSSDSVLCKKPLWTLAACCESNQELQTLAAATFPHYQNRVRTPYQGMEGEGNVPTFVWWRRARHEFPTHSVRRSWAVNTGDAWKRQHSSRVAPSLVFTKLSNFCLFLFLARRHFHMSHASVNHGL